MEIGIEDGTGRIGRLESPILRGKAQKSSKYMHPDDLPYPNSYNY